MVNSMDLEMEEKRDTSQQLEREPGLKKIVVVERLRCICNVKRKMLEDGWLFSKEISR